MTFNPGELRDKNGRWTIAGAVINKLERSVTQNGQTKKLGPKTKALTISKAGGGIHFTEHRSLGAAHKLKASGARNGVDMHVLDLEASPAKSYPEIHASDLSTPDARRSPAVSSEEFQQYAQRGAAKYAALDAHKSPATGLEGASWEKLKQHAYEQSRAPWGGTTTDSHTGQDHPADEDAYALTAKAPGMASVSVSPDASREEFDAAMEEAKKRFHDILQRPGHALGVFHDDDLKSIDIDPVLVTPSLDDVHDIGAYTGAVGGAYHFKSGDGYWPPHVKETAVGKKKNKIKDLSIQTPWVLAEDYDLSSSGGQLAYWKQVLPMKTINYTAKDGSRRQLNFDKEYLTDLANNKAVDAVPFILADKDNAHTMDPERVRGRVEKFEVRDGQGLFAKIVFPSPEAAKAVVENPVLGVSARIREGIQKSDGSTLSRGIIHVLGTLDPQVSGMSGWETADLSTEQGEVLDLTSEEYEEMAKSTKGSSKELADYTDEEIEALDGKELDEFLNRFAPGVLGVASEEDDVEDEVDEDEDERELEPALSNKSTADIELANQRAERADRRAQEALKRLAETQWTATRTELLGAGVPPHALDLAAPVLNRSDDMVIDLSVTDEDDVNVSEVVRGLLDALKGTVDLSNEQGHNGSWDGDGEDPDKALLDAWDAQV